MGFELGAFGLRAPGAEVDDALPLTRQLANMGMPLYGAQPPTGYSMKAETWVSSSALLNRMNFALALTGGKVRGVKVDAAHLPGSAVAGNTPPAGASEMLSLLEGELVAGGVSQQTHDSIVTQVQTSEENSAHSHDVSMIGGLLLGSPEFQRR